MMASWPCPCPGGGTAAEHAFALIQGRPLRLLMVPALFDEANRLRRFAVETMRRLDRLGIDSVLIDLPGGNESTQPLGTVDLALWRAAVAAAAGHFSASHVLALRGGALVVPHDLDLPLLTLAPVSGAAILRQMVRMRVLASREAGRDESAADLLELARMQGAVLGGHALSAAMIAGLEAAEPAEAALRAPSTGAALWLRAEPDEDPAQSEALAGWIAAACGA